MSQSDQLKTEANQAYQRGDFESTISLTNSVLQSNPRDHMALYLRGSARCEVGIRLRDKRMLREGIADARGALQYGEGKHKLYYIPYIYGMTKLAEVEGKNGHAEAAVTAANQALEQPSLTQQERAHLSFQRAGAKLFLKRFDEAIADFNAAIEADEKLTSAYMGRAEAHLAAGKPEKANESYDQMVASMPNSATAYDYRGVFRQQQGNFEQAINDFTRAIRIDPAYHAGYTNRGFTRLRVGQAAQAEADFTTALRLAPNQPIVYNLRSTARLAQGKTREGIEDQRQAARLIPDAASAQADLGLALYLGGQYPEALAAFEKAQSLDPGMRHLDAWRFIVLTLTGRVDDAKALTAAATAKAEGDRDWIDRLLAYMAGGSSEEALLGAVSQSDPAGADAQLCEAHFYIGMSKRFAGDNEAAESHFQKALDTQATRVSAYRGAQFALKKFETGHTL